MSEKSKYGFDIVNRQQPETRKVRPEVDPEDKAERRMRDLRTAKRLVEEYPDLAADYHQRYGAVVLDIMRDYLRSKWGAREAKDVDIRQAVVSVLPTEERYTYTEYGIFRKKQKTALRYNLEDPDARRFFGDTYPSITRYLSYGMNGRTLREGSRFFEPDFAPFFVVVRGYRKEKLDVDNGTLGRLGLYTGLGEGLGIYGNEPRFLYDKELIDVLSSHQPLSISNQRFEPPDIDPNPMGLQGGPGPG